MYKIVNSSNKVYNNNIIKIDNDMCKDLHEYSWGDDCYMLALAVAVLKYNDIDYVFTVSGKKCVSVVHNYSWGVEIKLYYQNMRGQERENTIECLFSVNKCLEVYKVRYTKTGHKISVCIGTIRRVIQ